MGRSFGAFRCLRGTSSRLALLAFTATVLLLASGTIQQARAGISYVCTGGVDTVGCDQPTPELCCGQNPLSCCATLEASSLSLYSIAANTSDWAQQIILVEARDEPYPCEQIPYGLYIYYLPVLTIASYVRDTAREAIEGTATSYATVDNLRLPTDIMDQLQADAAAEDAAHAWVRPTNVTQPGPPSLSGAGHATFDCLNVASAFAFKTGSPDAPSIVRIANITIVNSAGGPAILQEEGALLLDNVIVSGSSYVCEGCGGAAVYIISPYFVSVQNSWFHSNDAVFGIFGVQLLAPIDTAPQRPAGTRTWMSIDNTRFDNNGITLAGAIWFDTSSIPPAIDYDTLTAAGVHLRVTRSSFTNNTVVDRGTVIAAGLAGAAIAMTHSTVVDSSIVIAGSYFDQNGVGTTQPNNGGAFLLTAAGSLINVDISMLSSYFSGNHAGQGGAIGISTTSQQGLNVELGNNEFVSNTAGPLEQRTDGGAVSIHYGAPVDVRRVCDATLGCLAATNASWTPSAGSSSVASTFSMHDNIYRANSVLGFGGAAMLFWTADYFVPDQNGVASSTTKYPWVSPAASDPQRPPPDIITIAREQYLGNNAHPARQAGVGGALTFSLAPDSAIDQVVDYTTQTFNWRTWMPSTLVAIDSCDFEDSSAVCTTCSGGALYARNGQITITNTSFSRSTAGSFGGALFIDSGSARVSVSNSRFTNNVAVQRGQLIYSLSSAALDFISTSLDLDCTTTPSGIEIPIGGNLTLSGGTLMQCAKGYSLRNASQAQFRASTPELFLGVLMSSYSYSCVSCPANTYSFVRGSSVDDTWVDGLTEIECRSCPFGADCSRGVDLVYTKQGNWGHATVSAVDGAAITASATDIQVYSCPDGYCCPPGRTCSYDYCSGNRAGVLCSECKSGYSLVLGSPSCRLNADCNDAAWFWPLVIFGLALVTAGWLGLQIWGAGKRQQKKLDRDGTPIDPFSYSTVLRIVLLYWQLAGLLLVSTSDSPSHRVARWISSVANFHLSNGMGSENSDTVTTDAQVHSTGGVCVVKGMGGVAKISYSFLFPSLIVLWTLFFFAIPKIFMKPNSTFHLWIKHRFAPSTNGSRRPTPEPPVRAPTPMQTSSDEVVSDAVGIELQNMDGLEANPANPTGLASHDGNASAHAPEVAVHAPYVGRASVAMSTCAFHSPTKAGLDCFLTSAMLELTLSCYTSFLLTTSELLQCVSIGGVDRLFLAASTECYTAGQGAAIFFFVCLSLLPIGLWFLTLFMPCTHITRAIHQRYLDNTMSQATESVLLLRRYVFVLLSTFVAQPFARAYLLLVAAVASVFLHQRTHPYRSRLCNLVESVGLACLVGLAAIGIRSGAQLEAQPDQDSSLANTTEAMDGLAVALLFLPVATAIGSATVHTWLTQAKKV